MGKLRNSLFHSGVFACALTTSLIGCGEDTGDILEGGENDDVAALCGYTTDFDPSDPNDYVWTVSVVELDRERVRDGEVEVNYRYYPATSDPYSDQPTRSGSVQVAPGFWGEPNNLLAKDISFDDLINGHFQFLTVHSEWNIAMTSCMKQVSVADAVASHNAILETGAAPTVDELRITDPAVYGDTVAQLPGVVMMVDGDCDIPDESNPTETRSVLAWLAVSVEAKPDPKLVDPFLNQGIDWARAAGEGDVCHDSPFDYEWDMRVGQTAFRISNTDSYPGGNPVMLAKPGLFNDISALALQVDPEGSVDDYGTPPPQGTILAHFGYDVAASGGLQELLDNGFEFEIYRDDFGPLNESYTQCAFNSLELSDFQIAHEYGGAIRALRGDLSCSDGNIEPIGMQSIDIYMTQGRRTATHKMPKRPDLDKIPADFLMERAPE